MQIAAQTSNPGGLAGWLLNLLRSRTTQKAARHLQIVENLALGGRRQLTLVLCDGERFLVGGGPDGIATIVRVGPIPPAEIAC
jgi:flagellar biogenesis protein FliO